METAKRQIQRLKGSGYARTTYLVTEGDSFIAETPSEAVARELAAAPDLLEALGALGVIGDGYCFCSHDRDPQKQEHQPECAGARAALSRARGEG